MDDAALKRLIEESASETRAHFDRQTAEVRAHFDVTTESLRGDIRQVAEGVLANTERLDRVDARLDSVDTRLDRVEVRLDRVDARLDRVEVRLDTFADETRKGFSELGSKVTISYSELDRRLRTLETDVSDLRTRLERLESTSTH